MVDLKQLFERPITCKRRGCTGIATGKTTIPAQTTLEIRAFNWKVGLMNAQVLNHARGNFAAKLTLKFDVDITI